MLNKIRTTVTTLLLGLLLSTLATGALWAEGISTSRLEGLEWRDVGPWRGGRVTAITAWDHMVNQPLHETYEDEAAWETRLAAQVGYLLDVIDETGAPVTGGQRERLADLQSISAEQIEPINVWARTHEVPYVSLPES